MGHFFGHGKYRGVIRSKIGFLESVTFQFHARMLSSEVAQSLICYEQFSDLGVGNALSLKQIHPSTASERTTRQFENYLIDVKNFKHRQAFYKLRISAHCLEIEKGR